jgi:hypothetical protein
MKADQILCDGPTKDAASFRQRTYRKNTLIFWYKKLTDTIDDKFPGPWFSSYTLYCQGTGSEYVSKMSWNHGHRTLDFPQYFQLNLARYPKLSQNRFPSCPSQYIIVNKNPIQQYITYTVEKSSLNKLRHKHVSKSFKHIHTNSVLTTGF